ncbi:MAG: Flp family type IVb pilin [Bryobacteraceae bacterium]
MKRFLRNLLGDECGQDLIEYSLLVAFVALTTAGLFLGSGQNVSQTWSSANSVLTTAADQQNPPANTGGGGGDQGGDGGHDGGGDGGRH